MKRKKVTVYLDLSTHRWLAAYAKANSGDHRLGYGPARRVTARKLLTHAAFCVADFAGRKPGSWQALGALHIMMPAGYQERIAADVLAKLERRES